MHFNKRTGVHQTELCIVAALKTGPAEYFNAGGLPCSTASVVLVDMCPHRLKCSVRLKYDGRTFVHTRSVRNVANFGGCVFKASYDKRSRCCAALSLFGQSARTSNAWRSLASAGLVSKKICFNILGLFLIVLGESVPLCAADLQALPTHVSQMVMHSSVAACGSQASPLLHVFMLGIVPYVEAAIFVQLLTATVGWRRLPLPERYQMSQEQAQTSYGRAASLFISSILGTIISFGLAAVSVRHLIMQGVVGHKDFWGLSTSLVAGSAMVHMFSDMLTRFGLGQGIGFIYMVLIASRMQAQWQGALACLSGSHAAQCAAVVVSLTAGCVIVSNLKHFIPLVSTRIGNDGDDLETPRLPVVLCPHSTMVFIAAHWLGTMLAGWSMHVVNVVVAVTIIAGSVVDIGPTTTSYTSSLRDMQLAIPGVTQGEETKETLIASLLFLRLLGSLALLLLFASSRVADTFLSTVAGVQLSVIEILIVISTVTQSFRTVERSIQESRTDRLMVMKFQPLVDKS